MNVKVNPEALEELKSKRTPRNAAKAIFGTLISLGAAAAVLAVLSDPLKASKGILKVLMAAGVLVLASKAGDIAEEHFKEKVDDWADTFKDIQDDIKEEEGDEKHGTDTHAGRDSKQQRKEQGTGGNSRKEAAGETPGAPVRRRWWSKMEREREVLEMDEKDVPERPDTEGDHEGCGGKPDRSGDQG